MRILASATTALRRIVDIGLVLMIALVLFAVILGKVTPLIGRQAIVIGGGSMEPAIGLGSAIVVNPVDPAALAVDDVVSLRVGPERTTYTHRIVAIVDRADGIWIRTKGDANPAPDPTLVPATAVIGRVEAVIPFAGYLLALLSLPMGVLFVIGLAATLLAVAWLLESLEPDPRPAERPAAPASAGPSPSAAATAASPGVAQDLPGEPIAARPTGMALGAGGGLSMALDGHAYAGGGSRSARPTPRVAIERGREVRRRRARWLSDRGRDPRRTD
jgi:signal peptidase I